MKSFSDILKDFGDRIKKKPMIYTDGTIIQLDMSNKN